MAIPIVVLGCGTVGRALASEALSLGDEVRVLAVLDSSGGVVDPSGIPAGRLREILSFKEKGEGLGATGLAGEEAREAVHCLLSEERGVMVDATASEGTVGILLAALDQGWGVALANKRPLVGPWEDYRRLTTSGRLRYEATVGAGLPVISSLNSLLATGDEVYRIRGILSGTLGFLLHQVEVGVPFSQAVRAAMARGYTEPHPAEDLSGEDVARKALILARTLGLPLELRDVAVEPLCPPKLGELPVEEFLRELLPLDVKMQRRLEQAGRKGKVLRYLAEVSPEGARVGLVEVEWESPLSRARGPENLIVFETRRFREHPLVISGPGAGPASTAAGLLADIVRLGKEL
jgi:homoserine dehydrogenase